MQVHFVIASYASAPYSPHFGEILGLAAPPFVTFIRSLGGFRILTARFAGANTPPTWGEPESRGRGCWLYVRPGGPSRSPQRQPLAVPKFGPGTRSTTSDDYTRADRDFERDRNQRAE